MDKTYSGVRLKSMQLRLGASPLHPYFGEIGFLCYFSRLPHFENTTSKIGRSNNDFAWNLRLWIILCQKKVRTIEAPYHVALAFYNLKQYTFFGFSTFFIFLPNWFSTESYFRPHWMWQKALSLQFWYFFRDATLFNGRHWPKTRTFLAAPQELLSKNAITWFSCPNLFTVFEK